MMQAAALRPTSDLAQIEHEIWDELSRAARQPTHAWRRMVLSTQADDGWPDARTVVLRECRSDDQRLYVYTDARSVKVRQLQNDERAMLVAWSADLGWQLRLRCHIRPVTSGLSVASRWARIRLTPAAQDYLFPLPPGSDLPGEPSEQLPDDDREGWLDSQPALPADLADVEHPNTVPHHNFAVLEIEVLSVDWLSLAPHGHRRARFEAGGTRRWLAP